MSLPSVDVQDPHSNLPTPEELNVTDAETPDDDAHGEHGLTDDDLVKGMDEPDATTYGDETLNNEG